jgi:hemerythrin-like domain-containing protein
MTATEVLQHEHKIVLLILDAARREAQKIQDTGQVDAAKLDKILDFLRVFVDQCHHGKEEEYLFPKIQKKGLASVSGPIAVMLQEHERGRQRVKAIAAALPQVGAGDRRAKEALAVNLCACIELLEAHIGKENNVLFPMADQLLTPQEQQALVKAFEKHEAEEMGPGVHEKYHHLAHELASA